MDVFEAARTVLAVRDYADRTVPDAVIRRIVEAARLTASAGNGQPWHFVVVTEKDTLARLGGLIRSAPYVAGAPLAVVVAAERGNRYGVPDASRAIQSMVLTAWDAGVGSNWTGSIGMDDVRSLVEIPDRYEVVAVVAFGFPATPRTGNRKNRKPLDEVVSHERFGRSFE